MRLAMSSSPLPLPLTSSAIAQTHHHKFPVPSASASSASTPQLSQNPQCDSSGAHQNSSVKPRTIRFRLSELCRKGQLSLARQLFDTIPQPTTVLWNTLIIGYICNDMPDEAISLYSRFIRSLNSSSNRKCDPYTYSSVLKACAQTKQLLTGKAVQCHVLRSGEYPSRIVYNSLLNMYSACCMNSGFDLVERVFGFMRKRNVVSWNTMIAWYAKNGRFVEAIRCFVMMMKMGFRPTAVSFVNVFPAVSGLGDIEIANVVYGIVTKLGGEYAKDLFVVSSAITMYAELGCLDSARSIFDNCLEKNAHVWNTMIGGYIQNNLPIRALELFNEALNGENNIDDVTFLSAVTAASELRNPGFSRQLHSYLIKSSQFSSVILMNSVVSLYSRCNSIWDSFRVFSGMREKDVVSWNTMICALVQNGLDDEGLMLALEMQKLGFSIDDVTITAFLSAASNLRNQEIGKQTHACIIRHGIQFDGMDSYLIDMYAKSGKLSFAETIFDRNLKSNTDPAVWNAMISGFTQNGLVEKSLTIFRQMVKEKNVKPNAVTLASVLPVCSQLVSLSLGKAIHGFAIRNFLDENVFVGSALVDMYSKSGSITYAKRAFTNSAETNSVTYTNMIMGYGQHGMGEKAISLFNSMRDFTVEPDAVTFVAILTACSYSGLINEGLQIFESMEACYGVKPSSEHYACVVDMLGRVGRVFEAYEFALKLGREGDVLGIWGSLLSACRVHKEFGLGKIVANKLLEMEGGNDRKTGYHVLLSNMHAEEGNWENVKSMRRELAERGLAKEVGCSWISIYGQKSSFVSRDKKHPLCNEIYAMLGHLSANLRDLDCVPPFLSSE
ncbi:Pentatricopeptide repeat-containing protein -chloroplastic [Striga hermonthica]|uniref:Pentatricopeptide repeat-containing protein -chloroplastic n=1 Tax=Striga hermonthica TaxID=68872 RepID=A0A9N7RE46_STRHE|nr:Pentatricopeptide repeat-containing protein -chloroplastic [Striga hermonthica]